MIWAQYDGYADNNFLLLENWRSVKGSSRCQGHQAPGDGSLRDGGLVPKPLPGGLHCPA